MAIVRPKQNVPLPSFSNPHFPKTNWKKTIIFSTSHLSASQRLIMHAEIHFTKIGFRPSMQQNYAKDRSFRNKEHPINIISCLCITFYSEYISHCVAMNNAKMRFFYTSITQNRFFFMPQSHCLIHNLPKIAQNRFFFYTSIISPDINCPNNFI